MEELMANTSWRGIYLITSVINLCLMVFVPYMYPNLSTKDAIRLEQHEVVADLIRKTYIIKDEDHFNKIKGQLTLDVKTSLESLGSSISLWEGFTS
jgi:hypothetical protein